MVNKHRDLRRAKEDARAKLQAYEHSRTHLGPTLNIDREQFLLQQAVVNAEDAYDKFVALYGESGENNDKELSPNCYAVATLDRGMNSQQFAETEVKRATCCPFWNMSKKDINLDWMMMYSTQDGAPYMGCDQFRFAVYHDFGLDKKPSDTQWGANDTTKSFHIGDAFLSVGEVLCNPCLKRHELKVFNTSRNEISGCTLHIETQVECKTDTPGMAGCAAVQMPGFLPGYVPVEIDKRSGHEASEISMSACMGMGNVVIPSGVHLATASKKKSCCKKRKDKHKQKSHHCC